MTHYPAIISLKQEWSSGNNQIVYVEIFNQFTGATIYRFERWKYPVNSNNITSIIIMIREKVNPNIIYRIMKLLGEKKDVSSDFKELRRLK